MPPQLTKPSIQLFVLVGGIVLLLGFAFGISGAGLSSEPEVGQTAMLQIDGVTYRFAPTTCTITDTDFLAAGTGTMEGVAFWISASGDRVNLAVGPESEGQRPSDDEVWLTNVEEVQWHSEPDKVTATALMGDQRLPGAEPTQGNLSIECPRA